MKNAGVWAGLFLLLTGLATDGVAQLRNAARSPGVGERQLIFLETGLALGVGAYNYNGLATGVGARFQLPVRRSNGVTFTARTGLDFLKLKRGYYYEASDGQAATTYLSIPINVGPRVYFLKNYHAGLNLGADIGRSALESTAFHFEPSVGYVIPLRGGNYAEVGTSFSTSFATGSGFYTFRFAYGIGL